MSDAREGESVDKVDAESATSEADGGTPVETSGASDGRSDASDGGKQRRHEIRMALVNGVVSGVVAALVAAGVTVWVSNNQIESAKEQSAEEFRRDQRKVEYPRILSLATDLKNATEVAGADLGILSGQGVDFNAEYYSKTYPSAAEIQENAYTARDYYRNNGSPLGGVRSGWQSAYANLDQAIAEAQIAGTPEVLGIARALRDSYRKEYSASLADQLDVIRENSHAVALGLWETAPPDRRGPEPPKAPTKLADMSEDERAAELNQFIGVGEPDVANLGYDPEWASRSSCELMAKYVLAARDDLDLDDQLLMYTCTS